MIPEWHWTPHVFCIDVGSWCLHPRRESRRLWLQISPSLSSNTSGASWWFTAGTATNVPQLWVSSSCTEAWSSPPCRCALSLCLDPGLWNNIKKKKSSDQVHVSPPGCLLIHFLLCLRALVPGVPHGGVRTVATTNGSVNSFFFFKYIT